jgi:hypothetical protein
MPEMCSAKSAMATGRGCCRRRFLGMAASSLGAARIGRRDSVMHMEGDAVQII